MVEDIAVKYSAADAAEASENAPSATLAPPTPRHFSPYYKVFPHPSHPHVVMDAELMPKLLTRHGDSAPQSIGFVSDIEVNRKGGLSCPVRTGAVLACCHSPGTSIMHDANANNGAMEASISEAAKEGCAQALDKLETAALSALRSCDSFDALRKLESSGTIPTIRTVKVHRSHSFFQGVTVEFDPPKGGFSKVFHTDSETHLLSFDSVVCMPESSFSWCCHHGMCLILSVYLQLLHGSIRSIYDYTIVYS